MSDISEPNRDLYYFLEPLAELLEHYFDVELDGLDNIPDGPALLVGNHNGGVMAPDMFIFLRRYIVDRQFEDIPVGLAHDALFRVPGVRKLLCDLGAVPASRQHAVEALSRGKKVLVYPGGDWETHRPSHKRDEIDFGGRKGFIHMALEAQVPIVPVVAAGAHDGWLVLTRGEKIAHALRLDKMFRIKVFPIALGAPTGLILGPASLHIPMPSTILMRVLEPICLPTCLPTCLQGRADHAAEVDAGYREVTAKMQVALSELAARLRN
jgi:1-acyl-sn-glycerol-3-phosphate acyltransferase